MKTIQHIVWELCNNQLPTLTIDHIYDFLRVQGQLSRDTGPIDQDVRNFLSDLIGKLADMNDQKGNDAD